MNTEKARVTIEIDGKDYSLGHSPEAVTALSLKYDGLAPLMAAISRLNVQAMADVVIAGLGAEGREARDVLNAVAASSPLEILPKLSEFAVILANGGKSVRPGADE
jgi:hypothetical protein